MAQPSEAPAAAECGKGNERDLFIDRAPPLFPFPYLRPRQPYSSVGAHLDTPLAPQHNARIPRLEAGYGQRAGAEPEGDSQGMTSKQGSNTKTAPLDGITILDLTIFQNGPWATVMLSDMGASVIKIENPAGGDPGRRTVLSLVPRPINSYFETMNRNKRSLSLDLKCQEGREVFYRMVEHADVVTQNFRLGVVEKLKVDYETVRKINPRIVYASVSGLGPKGPHARDGIFDP